MNNYDIVVSWSIGLKNYTATDKALATAFRTTLMKVIKVEVCDATAAE